jgi:hypothetical protein
MKAPTLARLDLLAQAQEAQAQEQVRRHTAALRQSEAQTDMLAAYRNRLAATWQDGTAVEARHALRAARFGASALTAARQVEETRAQAAQRLEAAVAELAALRQRRRTLAGKLAAARAQDADAAERRAAQLIPPRRRGAAEPER